MYFITLWHDDVTINFFLATKYVNGCVVVQDWLFCIMLTSHILVETLKQLVCCVYVGG